MAVVRCYRDQVYWVAHHASDSSSAISAVQRQEAGSGLQCMETMHGAGANAASIIRSLCLLISAHSPGFTGCCYHRKKRWTELESTQLFLSSWQLPTHLLVVSVKYRSSQLGSCITLLWKTLQNGATTSHAAGAASAGATIALTVIFCALFL